uniref:TSC22 domain family protein 1 n=1 Tax=Ascaris lumbricoides TaxID=6252 RepID=A0A0M3HXB6_ASCLU
MVVLHASPTSCFTASARFTRMVSVEELDSNLTLLTRHSPSLVKAPRQKNLGTEMTTSSPIPPESPPENVSSPTGSSMITPPGSPHPRPTRCMSPFHAPELPSPAALMFDYGILQTPQISPTSRVVGANPPNTPTTPATTPMFGMIITASSAAGNVPGGPNVVAIDNKIEQAMDLVKTHLTFAVREEVEILRSTIVDLEAKVAQLESQNQVLKQFAPAEVVANLALLVQNAQQQKQLQQQLQQAQAASVSLPTNAQPTLAPPAQPVIVTTQPIHAAQMQQQPVGAVPVLTTATTLPPSVDATPIVIPNSISSAGDTLITNSASQSMSTLNSMAVNVSSSTSNTATL